MTGVFRKEIRSCRVTMTGYVFISFILAVIGMYFSFNNLNNASPRFETVLQSVQFVFVVFIHKALDELVYLLPRRMAGGKRWGLKQERHKIHQFQFGDEPFINRINNLFGGTNNIEFFGKHNTVVFDTFP